MDSINITEFVGNIAVVTTIMQFLSGILVCKQYIANKSTGDASVMPFLCGIISAALWLMYGSAKHDHKIMFVNAIGVMLMIGYTLIFIKYTLKKAALMRQVALKITVLLIFMIYSCTLNDEKFLIATLGTVASVFTLITVAAPMIKLRHVLKTKNTECLPFPMILMSFLVCSLWTCYGALQNDLYLWTVNFIGVGLAVCQLSLFVYFPRTACSTSSILPKYVVH